jgi:LemA protein
MSMTGIVIAIALGLLLVFWAVGAHGRMVGMRAAQRTAFARIEEQIRHRHELIPGLVETAGGYLPAERQSLEEVIAARNLAVEARAGAAADPGDADRIRDLVQAEAALAATMARLSLLSNACPALMADTHRGEIDAELTSTEHRLAFARQAYNDAVEQYNRALSQFPGSILARLSGMRPATPLQAALSPLDRRQGRAGF